MAEAANNHIDSKHTVDDLFQFLVRACDIPPATAKKEIREKLQLDKLQIDLRIRGGARKILPERPATEEELQDKKSTGVVMFHLYEFAPPEGITEPVPFQHWDADSVFCLTIRDGHLIIEPNCALDYPWGAYSFTVANWSLVEELWPNPNRAGSELLAPASKPEHPPKGPLVTQQNWWNAYLTSETKSKLLAEYKGVTEASTAISSAMAEDPTIDGGAYEPRYIEQLLREAKVFPPRRR